MKAKRLTKPNVCPKCGSENLEYDGLEVADDQLYCYYPFTCEDCGETGEEWYEMEYHKTYSQEEIDNFYEEELK